MVHSVIPGKLCFGCRVVREDPNEPYDGTLRFSLILCLLVVAVGLIFQS